MQLLPRLIIVNGSISFDASNMFKFIFTFSIIKSVRFVLFATMPPTFAAALISISGLNSEISLSVSSKENKLVSFLVEK